MANRFPTLLVRNTVAAKDRRSRRREGIYGAEACQRCGKIDTFFGWNGAMASHFPWHGTDFVCGRCCRELIPADVCSLTERDDAVWPVLEAQTHRYCVLCRARVDRCPERRLARFWLCGRCRDRLAELAQDNDLGELLRDVVRRRYRTWA